MLIHCYFIHCPTYTRVRDQLIYKIRIKINFHNSPHALQFSSHDFIIVFMCFIFQLLISKCQTLKQIFSGLNLQQLLIQARYKWVVPISYCFRKIQNIKLIGNSDEPFTNSVVYAAPTNPYLQLMNPIRSFNPYCCKMPSNIILPSAPRSL